MSEFKHSSIDELPVRHVCEHDGYEYFQKVFVRRSEASHCVVNIFEIPPMKSAFPYHYHHNNEVTNDSKTEKLIYIDFDTSNEIDVTVYPDSDKIAIWGKGVNRIFRNPDQVSYYENE
ncbi:MAG: cupin [Clostridia bacterium]|nr:cupin [Clostridia bacterium]